jgi:hypothetical protein
MLRMVAAHFVTSIGFGQGPTRRPSEIHLFDISSRLRCNRSLMLGDFA